MVLRRSIEKPLAAFANISDRNLDRGARAELEVCAQLRMRNVQICLQRFETPYAEVDIVALTREGVLLLIEVKASSWPDGESLGLSRLQLERLKRARKWVESETSRAVEIYLARPSTQRGRFEFVPLF